MTLPFPDQPEYGVSPLHVMASMSGLEFVRGLFDGTLPAAPIMQPIEPFGLEAEKGRVSFSSRPLLRHYNPIGSVHGGYAATLLDSAMSLAVQSTLDKGWGYTTLEFKISFIRAITADNGPIRSEGWIINAGRRIATAEGHIKDEKGRVLSHATTTCLVFELPK